MSRLCEYSHQVSTTPYRNIYYEGGSRWGCPLSFAEYQARKPYLLKFGHECLSGVIGDDVRELTAGWSSAPHLIDIFWNNLKHGVHRINHACVAITGLHDHQ